MKAGAIDGRTPPNGSASLKLKLARYPSLGMPTVELPEEEAIAVLGQARGPRTARRKVKDPHFTRVVGRLASNCRANGGPALKIGNHRGFQPRCVLPKDRVTRLPAWDPFLAEHMMESG